MKYLLPLIACVVPAFAEEAALKFRPLFNGKDLTGWSGEGYVVEGDTIACTPAGKNLMTEDTFSNYVLDFEFQLTPGANNGLGIHYPGTGDGAYTGMELQILDSSAEKYKDLKPYQHHAGLYTLKAAKQGALKPVGEWNKERVTVNGPNLRVEVNGQEVLTTNLDEINKEFPKHEGAKRRSGHIAFLGHGDRVLFRKISIAETAPLANVEGVKAAGFTQILDGNSLAGWKSDKEGDQSWSVMNGVLKHDGKGKDAGNLWSENEYGDFILVFDWRWNGTGPQMKRPVIGPDGKETGESVEVQEFDSGVYLRDSSKSQVNLWNWPCGSGEVYGYRTDESQPAEVRAGATPKLKADKPLGEWNRMMVIVRGDRITVNLNDKKVIDNALLPGMPAKGKIAFQQHGSSIDFANVWVKEL